MAIATPKKTEPKETPRGRLRAWLEQRIDGVDVLDMSEIVNDAKDCFLSDRAWADAMYGTLVAREIRELIGQMRDRLTIGDEVVTRKGGGMKARADALARKWGDWIEHTNTGYVRLMAMTKPQLIEAASEREGRGQIEFCTARLWRAIAEQLVDDSQLVRDKFRPDQLEALEHDILVED